MSENLFPNHSQEGGWWHPDGIPELQIPEGWDIQYYEGDNDIDPNWDYVRPEVRVLPRVQLPQHEQFLVLDGDRTGKGFKGAGPILFSMFTKDKIYMPAGTGRLVMPIYPDIIMGYDPDTGAKIWADDPMAGMVAIIHGDTMTPWSEVEFGVFNVIEYTWTQDEPTEDRFGFTVRCPFPLPNNGWFYDDFSLTFQEATGRDVYTAAVKVPAGFRRYDIMLIMSEIGQ